MTVQVRVSTQLTSGEEGAKPAENGTATVRVQRKATVPVFLDGRMQNQEQWQDLEVKVLANEEGMFSVHSGQRLILEEQE